MRKKSPEVSGCLLKCLKSYSGSKLQRAECRQLLAAFSERITLEDKRIIHSKLSVRKTRSGTIENESIMLSSGCLFHDVCVNFY